jgi:hypothetical protein
MLEKAHTDARAMLTTHWDPSDSEARFVKGLDFVSLRYQAGPGSLPTVAPILERTVLERDARSPATQSQKHVSEKQVFAADALGGPTTRSVPLPTGQ